MLRKKRNGPKLATLKQLAVLITLIFPLLGANQRGPVEPTFDRFAMSAARICAPLDPEVTPRSPWLGVQDYLV